MALSINHPLLSKNSNRSLGSGNNSSHDSSLNSDGGGSGSGDGLPLLSCVSGGSLSLSSSSHNKRSTKNHNKKGLPLKQRTSSIDTRRDYTVQTWYSVLVLLDIREYFITVDHFSIWRRHLAWAKEDGKDLRDYMTQRYSSSMVFMSLLLGIELSVLFDSCNVATDIRTQLYDERYASIQFWIGITIITSIILTLLSLLSTFTAWAMVSAVEKNNAHCIFRSSIGQFASELPGRFIVFSIYTFLLWVIMFLFVLLPLGVYSFALLIVTVSLFFQVITAFSAFGRIIMHTGAMGSNQIFDPNYERLLLPHSLHSQLLLKARSNLNNNTSIISQYRKAKSQKPIDNQFQYSTNPLFTCTDDDISCAQLNYTNQSPSYSKTSTSSKDSSNNDTHDRAISTSSTLCHNSSDTASTNNYGTLQQPSPIEELQHQLQSKEKFSSSHVDDANYKESREIVEQHYEEQIMKGTISQPRRTVAAAQHDRGDSLVVFVDTVFDKDYYHSQSESVSTSSRDHRGESIGPNDAAAVSGRHARGDSFVRFADTVVSTSNTNDDNDNNNADDISERIYPRHTHGRDDSFVRFADTILPDYHRQSPNSLLSSSSPHLIQDHDKTTTTKPRLPLKPAIRNSPSQRLQDRKKTTSSSSSSSTSNKYNNLKPPRSSHSNKRSRNNESF